MVRLHATRISIFCLTLMGLGWQSQAQSLLSSSRSDNATGDNWKRVSDARNLRRSPAVNYYVRGQETKVEFSPQI
jgi:hypothetical protein